MSIYLHWNQKVDKYYETKNSSKKDMYYGTEKIIHFEYLEHDPI